MTLLYICTYEYLCCYDYYISFKNQELISVPFKRRKCIVKRKAENLQMMKVMQKSI